MKSQAWRHAAAAYPFHTELWPRLTDVDTLQHLNNVALVGLHGEACQRWQRTVLGEQVWLGADPVLRNRRLATDYLAESHYPAPLDAGVRLLEAGPQGFVLAVALFQHGRCVGLHEAEVAAMRGGEFCELPLVMQHTLKETLAAQPPVPTDVAASTLDSLGIDSVAPLSAYPYSFKLQARYGDRDLHDATSDIAASRYAEQARAGMLHRIMGTLPREQRVGVLVGQVRMHFLHRGSPTLKFEVATAVERIGARSLALRTALFDDKGCQAIAHTVLVAVDPRARRPTPLPEALRGVMQSLMLK
ncbi:MAG: hypothetical protein HY855_10435 [Burkholderiales bacterium]|nr:hypothetical protein [Burkholderiales bacterium]